MFCAQQKRSIGSLAANFCPHHSFGHIAGQCKAVAAVAGKAQDAPGVAGAAGKGDLAAVWRAGSDIEVEQRPLAVDDQHPV